MKIKGHDFSRKSIQLVVLPRGYDAATGEKIPNVVLRAAPIQSFEEFNILVPEPKAPQVIIKGGEFKEDREDEGYVEQVKRRNRLRMYWLILKSLQINEIEWETVKMDSPKTWPNIDAEFETAQFTGLEVQKIVSAVMNANNLNPSLYEEALADFQRGLVQASASTSGLPTGPNSTQSGQPAEQSE